MTEDLILDDAVITTAPEDGPWAQQTELEILVHGCFCRFPSPSRALHATVVCVSIDGVNEVAVQIVDHHRVVVSERIVDHHRVVLSIRGEALANPLRPFEQLPDSFRPLRPLSKISLQKVLAIAEHEALSAHAASTTRSPAALCSRFPTGQRQWGRCTLRSIPGRHHPMPNKMTARPVVLVFEQSLLCAYHSCYYCCLLLLSLLILLLAVDAHCCSL